MDILKFRCFHNLFVLWIYLSKSSPKCFWGTGWKENVVFGEVGQALLMKSNPFVFFAAGCILSVGNCATAAGFPDC